jgi:TRAP-type uncharacterized transport system fused permease subunit
LMLLGKPLDILQNGITAFLGVIALSAGVMGFLRRKLSLGERLIAAACGLLLIEPSLGTDIVALIVFAYMYFSQRFGFSFRFWHGKNASEENVKGEMRGGGTTV